MTITPHNLIDTNSNNSINDEWLTYTVNIIKQTESFKGFIYTDSKGIPTLGYGTALVVYSNGAWSPLTTLELNDIFDGVSHPLTTSDIALLTQAANYLNGNKNPSTGVVTDGAGNVLTNPFNSTANVTNWTISTVDGDTMLENSLSSKATAVDYVSSLSNHLGLLSDGITPLWDKYKDSREGAALLSLWYNGRSNTIGNNLINALKE